MAPNICGTWELISSENFDEYMKAIGVPDERRVFINQHFNSNFKREIKQDGDNWTIKTISVFGEREVSFKIGVEFTSSPMGELLVKTVVTIDGDTLVETVEDDGVNSVLSRKREGDLMVVTMAAGDVVCTRKYKLI